MNVTCIAISITAARVLISLEYFFRKKKRCSGSFTVLWKMKTRPTLSVKARCTSYRKKTRKYAKKSKSSIRLQDRYNHINATDEMVRGKFVPTNWKKERILRQKSQEGKLRYQHQKIAKPFQTIHFPIPSRLWTDCFPNTAVFFLPLSFPRGFSSISRSVYLP